MTPELITAVKERFQLGYTKDVIRDELRRAGYSESVIEEVLEKTNTDYEAPLVRIVPVEQSAEENYLPNASNLFSNSFTFAKNKFGLVLALAAPFSVILIVGYFLNTLSLVQPNITSTLISLLSFAALIAYLFILGSSLYIVAEGREQSVYFKEAFTWTKRNFLGLIWIYILTALVVYGGFLLFIIPGVIVSFLVYFSQYVYIKEEVRGLDALLRSRDLVMGKWWQVAKILILIGLMFLAAFLVLGGLAGLISAIAGDGAISDLLFAFVFQLISAGVTLMGLCIGMELYRNLAAARPANTNGSQSTSKWKYRLLAVFGVFSIFIVLALLGAFLSLSSTIEEQRVDELDSYLDTSAKERASKLRFENMQREAVIEEEAKTVIIE